MSNNKVASILKIGAIVLFVIMVFIAIVISEETMGGEYTTSSYDGMLFFTTLLNSALPCALIYGLGELIQINHDNRYFLANIAKQEQTASEENEEAISK